MDELAVFLVAHGFADRRQRARLRLTAVGVGQVAQRPLAGQDGLPVHGGPDGVLDPGAAPRIEHAGGDQ
ncbi:hypothetical protein [Amycolatopsis sp.]|uniref:hypothetical protein n=1 Tax=Amycolatopsis sp. TaxID=37632 RepID=UPI002B91BBDF|nr:hypothetical protein [Amycolatopsis sp.]HVV13387.1 hypothetical protein [Amycolatopsis sp.]